MNPIQMRRHVRTAIYGAIFGFVTGYAGVFIDHWIESSPTPIVMYARDSRFFWFTIPSIPGEFLALLSSSRDWLWDEAWLTYRFQITAFNGIFWLGAFPILRGLYTHRHSRTATRCMAKAAKFDRRAAAS